MARAKLVLALLCVSAIPAAHADEILLRPEIGALQFVSVHIEKMPTNLRRDWLKISGPGRELLTRERGAVAVSVSDSGVWSYRVIGQSTTSRLTLQKRGEVPTDVASIKAVLSHPKVRDVLAIYTDTPADAPDDVAVRAYQYKLDLIEQRSFGELEKNSLLSLVGERLGSERPKVRDILLRDPATTGTASRSLDLARAREANAQKAIIDFAKGTAPGSKSFITTNFQVWPDDVRTFNFGGDDVTVVEIQAATGRLVLKCSGDMNECTNADGSVSTAKATDAIYLPDAEAGAQEN